MKIVKLSTGEYAIQEKGVRMFGMQITSDTYYSQSNVGVRWSFGSWEFWAYCVRDLEETKRTYDLLNPQIVEEIDYE